MGHRCLQGETRNIQLIAGVVQSKKEKLWGGNLNAKIKSMLYNAVVAWWERVKSCMLMG